MTGTATPSTLSAHHHPRRTPAWGGVKSGWRRESIGRHDGSDRLVDVVLAPYRQLPRLKRFLAYLPEGPVIDWSADNLDDWLAPMTTYLRGRGAFGIRMGPPVVTRRWHAATVMEAIADGAPRRLGDVPADSSDETGARVRDLLRREDWRPLVAADGFSVGRPQYVFQAPLAGRGEDDVLRG